MKPTGHCKSRRSKTSWSCSNGNIQSYSIRFVEKKEIKGGWPWTIGPIDFRWRIIELNWRSKMQNRRDWKWRWIHKFWRFFWIFANTFARNAMFHLKKKKISLKKFQTWGKLHCKVDINEDINDESEWLPIWLPCISTYLTFHFHAVMKLGTNGALIATETIQRALLSSLFGCLKIIGNNCSLNTDLYDTTTVVSWVFQRVCINYRDEEADLRVYCKYTRTCRSRNTPPISFYATPCRTRGPVLL